MCMALARVNSRTPSNTCQTGFQYTPVDSMATWVHPCEASQSANASNSLVVEPKVFTSRATFLWAAMRTQATTVF
jgi:hypothetical protein